MPGFFRTRRFFAASLAAAALAGAGGGAALYAATTGTTTHAVTTAAFATPIASAAQLTVGQIYRSDAKGVVQISVETAGGPQSFPFGGGSQQSQAQGSGFVYDTEGHIVTNDHVVDGASAITVTFSDGSTYKATVVGTDPSTDLAVIHVNVPASVLHPLALADSAAVSVGDGVVAIGSPFGLAETVTSGIVSARGREIQAPDNSAITDTIQTDAAINHGNSGGPLLDMQGNVIGVTSQIESDSGGNDGIGFAVASNTTKRVVDGLIANGKVTHAFLGVSVETIPAQLAQSLGTSPGVAVTAVQRGSAAADASLKASTASKTVGGASYPTGGDVITAVGGVKVTTSEQLKSLIAQHSPGDNVDLAVVRGGKSRTVTVKLGSRS